MLVSDQAGRIARALSGVDLSNPDVTPLRDRLAPDVTLRRVQMVAVYRVSPGALPGLEPVVDVATPALPPAYSRAAADRLAAQALSGSSETRSIEALGAEGDLLHAAAVVRGEDGAPIGVVVATDYLTGELATRSRRLTQAFESYNQLRVLQAAADRAVPGLLHHGDADDSDRRHLAGVVLREAHHRARAGAGGGREGDWRRPPRTARRAAERRRIRRADGGVQHHGRRAREQPPQGRAFDGAARAQAQRGRDAPPLHRDHPGTNRHGRGLGGCGRNGHDHQRRRFTTPAARPVDCRPAPARRRSTGPICSRWPRSSRAAAGHEEMRRRRRSPSRAMDTSSIWRRSPRRWSARPARAKGPSSSSTT